MSAIRDPSASRRNLIRFLAASPLFAGSAGTALAQALLPRQQHSDPITWWPRDPGTLIKDPKEAVSVFDCEPVMRQNVPPAHFGYMASGVNDEMTLRANRDGFAKFQLRPRRLVDVSKVDTSVDFFGVRYDTPIILAPVGGQKAFNPEGEVGSARGAKPGNHLQILSTVTTWDFLKRLRDHTKMKILVKGILAHEDAKIAADAGLDGIIVSNHGGRSEDSGRSTIDALPEILEAAGGRIPVLVDSGFRRGTDIVKAPAMGAKGGCGGRPVY